MGDFVGRQAELTALTAGLASLSSSRGSWAHVVVGEPGIGKTSLLGKLGEAARLRGALVLAGCGAELARDVPFGLLADACDDYLRALDERRLLALCGRQLTDLVPIFPALAGLGQPGAGDPGGLTDDLAPDARFRAHRALRGLLERLAATAPLVLVLDDVHWADPASVQALDFLLRRPPAAPVLLVLAWRPAQAARLTASLAITAESLPGNMLSLGGMDERELGELLGGALGSRELRALHRASGGNPFYAQALATGTGSGPGGKAAGGHSYPAEIPGTVVAAVRREIDALPPAVRRLAQGAAVAGEPFDPELAACCAGQSAEQALAGLDQLIAAGIVRPADSPRRFAFRHPIVLRAVYDCAGPGWRLAAHARAADALARRGAPITAQAHHVALAASAGDVSAATLLAAAAAEVEPRAPASAADWAKAALRLLPSRPELLGQRLGLLVSLARTHTSLGHLQAAHDAWLQALELAPEGDSRRTQLIAGCASAEVGLGRWESARSRLTEALAALPADQCTAQADLCQELAVSWLATMGFGRAAHYAAQAASLTAGTDTLRWATATGFRCLVRAATEDSETARSLVAEVAPVLDGLPSSTIVQCLDALYYLGWAERMLEDYPASLGHLGRGIALAGERSGSPRLIPAMAELAKVLAASGRIGEARELIDTAAEMARLSGLVLPLQLALAAKVAVLTTAGDLTEATATAAEVQRSGSLELAYQVADMRRRLALSQLEAGRPERFAAEIRALEESGSAEFEATARCELLEARTQAELELGNPQAAAQYAARAEKIGVGLGLPVSAGLAHRARARIALAAADPAGALILAEETLALFEKAGALVQIARTRVLLGSILAALGRRDDALREIQTAGQALAGYGAAGSAEQVRRLQRRLRRASPAPPRGAAVLVGPATLSRREREIAELVARGLTNRDIAADLHISTKTVETHLSRILAKLDVPSRAAVARAMSGPGDTAGHQESQ